MNEFVSLVPWKTWSFGAVRVSSVTMSTMIWVFSGGAAMVRLWMFFERLRNADTKEVVEDRNKIKTKTNRRDEEEVILVCTSIDPTTFRETGFVCLLKPFLV